MAVDNGYIPTNVGLTTLTLPAAAVVGDIIEVCGEGAGGWDRDRWTGQGLSAEASQKGRRD